MKTKYILPSKVLACVLVIAAFLAVALNFLGSDRLDRAKDRVRHVIVVEPRAEKKAHPFLFDGLDTTSEMQSVRPDYENVVLR